jgi:tetratricopeptide (TPR) repeat protein
METSSARSHSFFFVLISLRLFFVGPSAPANVPRAYAQQLDARTVLAQGVESFKNGNYDEAIKAFSQAKQLDPNFLNARLYLATTYASIYIPGAPSDENRKNGQAAVDEFSGVLDLDPNNLSAIDGMGAILFQMAGTPYDPKMFEASKSYHKRHEELQPDDPEPYYWVGVINWTLAFHANGEYRAEFNRTEGHLEDSGPLPEPLREKYATEYGALIEEGIDSMKHAMALRPDYDDAMAYLNLLFRRKADFVADDEERAQLRTAADELIDKIKEIKQKRALTQPDNR